MTIENINEKLTDEQLENISGGSCHEMADDTRFLNSLNGSTNRYGATKCFFYGDEIKEELKKGWATVGITCELSSAAGTNPTKNKYYLNGKQISQGEARKHAMQVTGHWMDVGEWQW